MNKLRVSSAAAAVALLLAASCQQATSQNVPNRVLDRPTDVTLICADRVCTDEDGVETCTVEMQPLSVCGADTGTCTSSGAHLVGFVANSERNEIGMFTKCGDRLVDMNPDVPGYNFVPAGVLPTEMTASGDGCRVFSANVGSCDLTVLDGQGMARYALELDPLVDQPSSLVGTLVPRRFDQVLGTWVPLGARPGDLIAAPLSLTTAPGVDPGATLDPNCDPLARGSVYVSFPTCNLIAEVDAQTGNILQSRQLVSDGMGGQTVVDSGLTPVCPVECPVQFDGALPDDLPAVDQAGVFPQTLELLTPPPDNGEGDFDAADEAADSRSLFVGGLGSDVLFEIRMSASGIWEGTNTLELQDAGGIKRVRVSPPVNAPAGGSNHSQFVYVVAGDGSTRVVGRPLPTPIDELGVECETQLDPSVVPPGADLACIPVAETPTDGQPAERRGLARGPGIRSGTGGEVTDWTFYKTYVGDAEDQNGIDDSSPFLQPGVVAVGVTTRAEAMYVVIDHPRVSGDTQVDQMPGVTPGTDPTSVMDVRLYPHAQWPNPLFNDVALPLVANAVPVRTLPSVSNPARFLSPSLRQIDGAYIGSNDEVRAGLNLDQNFDELDQPSVEVGDGLVPLYDEGVVKAVVHDYRSWFGADWELEWEGVTVPTRSTGRIDCANPGWEGGTCLVSEPDDARLIDESATFCDEGVLPGDKLIIIGCTDDDDCGDGRRCLLETAGGGESSGICVSGQAYADRAAELRQICADFISDPCGEAVREFTITRAFQDELWIQSMNQRPLSHLFEYGPCDGGTNNALVGETCLCQDGFEPCGGTEDALECCEIPGAEGYPILGEEHGSFVCSVEQPPDGCIVDADCGELPFPGEGADPNAPDPGADAGWQCIEERCRRPCRTEAECTLRRLPGPTCFGEFIRYQVGVRNAFLVRGPVDFEGDLVDIDPGTGECRPTQDAERSRLLTSRIPLPATDDADDPDWAAIPICPTDTVEPSNPNPCRIAVDRNASSPFHNLAYQDVTVSALRFSNPVFSLILDLTSIDSLTSDVPGYDGLAWAGPDGRFIRDRIPRGYLESFRVESGYRPFASFLRAEGQPQVTLPVRIVDGPEDAVVYVVDSSGPGSTSAVRGQVIRATLGSQVAVDPSFDGVR